MSIDIKFIKKFVLLFALIDNIAFCLNNEFINEFINEVNNRISKNLINSGIKEDNFLNKKLLDDIKSSLELIENYKEFDKKNIDENDTQENRFFQKFNNKYINERIIYFGIKEEYNEEINSLKEEIKDLKDNDNKFEISGLFLLKIVGISSFSAISTCILLKIIFSEKKIKIKKRLNKKNKNNDLGLQNLKKFI